jgi:hypothetical protein
MKTIFLTRGWKKAGKLNDAFYLEFPRDATNTGGRAECKTNSDGSIFVRWVPNTQARRLR